MLSTTACTGTANATRTETADHSSDSRSETTPDHAAHVSRAKAIEHYRTFLAEYPQSARRKEVLRRLADLEVAQASTMLALSLDDYSSPDPTAESRALFTDAAGHYQALMNEYPEERTNDEVIYQLARAQEGSGELARSTATLERVGADSGDSELYSDARFRQAEAQFSRGDYGAAESSYAAIVSAGPGSSIYIQALYKLGWTQYKQGYYEPALATLDTLLDEMLPRSDDVKQRITELPPADRSLLDDTLRATSLCFSNLGGAAAVAEHFDRNGARTYESLVFVSLAELYLSEERFNDAAQTYLTLSARSAAAEHAPDYHDAAIAIYVEAGFNERAVEAKEQFALTYGPSSDAWLSADPSLHRGKLELIEIDIIDHYDRLTRQSRDSAIYSVAVSWYDRYLSTFGQSERIPEIQFRLAELAYFQGDLELALRQYENSAYGHGAHPLGAEAGYGSVLTLQSMLDDTGGDERRALVPRFVAGAERFANQFPSDHQVPDVLLLTAQEVLIAGEPASAAMFAERVLQTRPPVSSESRQAAWMIYARAQNQLGNPTEAEVAYRAALELTEPSSEDYKTLQAGLASSIFQQGEQSLAEEQPEKAAAHFGRAAAAASDAPVGAEASYQRALVQLSMEQWADAAVTLEEFTHRYPEHPRYADATRKLAGAYQSAGESALAADSYIAFAKATSSAERRRAALIEASILYREAGRFMDSETALALYIDEYPEIDDQGLEVRWQYVEVARAKGDTAAESHWLKIIVASAKDSGRAISPRAEYFAAEATLGLAQIEHEAYRRIRLVDPIRQTVAEKAGRMQSALEMYEAVASFAVSEPTCAATYHSAELYRDFGEALRRSERPGGLDSNQLAAYEASLEEQAASFSSRAIELHEANFGRVGNGLYNPWVAKSLEQLAVLAPRHFARREIGEPFVDVRR